MRKIAGNRELSARKTKKVIKEQLNPKKHDLISPKMIMKLPKIVLYDISVHCSMP